MVTESQATEARALWYVGPGRGALPPETGRAAAPGGGGGGALYGALSRGTERLVFSGRVPESEFERMRAPFMAGAFPFPVQYGYPMEVRRGSWRGGRER